mmetsp:Transcript_85535/g.254922  ORF Transcript_85535/g.254922 Transcript_85535/m.254922 type:complete len:294 (+) Transcript_85535:614-1495(+)
MVGHPQGASPHRVVGSACEFQPVRGPLRRGDLRERWLPGLRRQRQRRAPQSRGGPIHPGGRGHLPGVVRSRGRAEDGGAQILLLRWAGHALELARHLLVGPGGVQLCQFLGPLDREGHLVRRHHLTLTEGLEDGKDPEGHADHARLQRPALDADLCYRICCEPHLELPDVGLCVLLVRAHLPPEHDRVPVAGGRQCGPGLGPAGPPPLWFPRASHAHALQGYQWGQRLGLLLRCDRQDRLGQLRAVHLLHRVRADLSHEHPHRPVRGESDEARAARHHHPGKGAALQGALRGS